MCVWGGGWVGGWVDGTDDKWYTTKHDLASCICGSCICSICESRGWGWNVELVANF